MSSPRPVGRYAPTLDKDRASVCRFAFSGGRRGRTAPASPNHPHFGSPHPQEIPGLRRRQARLRHGLFFLRRIPPRPRSRHRPWLHPKPFRINTYITPRKC